jgi:hypothetical protein
MHENGTDIPFRTGIHTVRRRPPQQERGTKGGAVINGKNEKKGCGEGK